MFKRLKSTRSICILLCFLLSLTVVGCTSNTNIPETTVTEDNGLFKAGTYNVTVPGHNGDVKVEVVISENEILSVKILEHKESQGISDPAIERIPKAIVEDQTLAVDAVAGATITSKAIIAAVTEAIKQAGGDVKAFSVKKADDTKTGEAMEYTTDVLVIGGGGAGLAAAVTAHQNGAKVILIEKMPRLGGNTILSGGALNAVDPKRQQAQNIEDSVEKHFTQTIEGGDKMGKPELVRILAENAYSGVEWLEGLGMKFNDEVFTVLGGLWPRAHKPSTPLGTGFIDTYSKYIEANEGIEVFLDTQAIDFIVEGDRVVGVKAKDLDSDVIIKANNGIVLATGGFGMNIDMRNQYNKHWPDLTNLMSTNHPGATGDGIKMSEKVNANLIGMEYIQLLPMGDPQTGSLSGNIEQGVENRIFVNMDGNRFVDEGARRDVMTKALLEQKDAYMWIVLDKHSYPTGGTKNNFNESIDELIAQNRAYKADTLEDLAKQINVDPANLVKAVDEFNKSVEKGGADQFGRTLFADKIDTAPFYAGARVPTVHHTMGGLEINEDAQVIDANGNIISGLYAAGEVTGGIHGTNRLGGNALADIVVFGRIAGASAAAKK